MDSVQDARLFTVRVSPFGNLRVKAYFQLTAAYRRLSRPSSALGAKAFTLCSFSLEQLPLVLSRFAFLPELANNCWVVNLIVYTVLSPRMLPYMAPL